MCSPYARWFILFIALGAACRPPQSLPLLAPGHPVKREIRAGEIHRYRLSLAPGQYLRAEIDPAGIGVRARLYAPESTSAAGSHYRQRGPIPVTVLAKAAGEYQLEVCPLDQGAAQGSYEVSIAELRGAVAGDRSRIAAEQAFSEGELLRAACQAQSGRQAAAKYQAALSHWRTTGNRREEARTLNSLGEVHDQLGEHRAALADYTAALALSRAITDRRLESEALNGMGAAYSHAGDNQTALTRCDRALALSREAGARREEAEALNSLGDVHKDSGDTRAALEYFRQALGLWRDLGDRRGQALALLNLGYACTDLSETDQAFDYFNQALGLWRAAGDCRGEARTLNWMGRLLSRLGEKQAALDLFEKAIPLIKKVEDPFWEASLLSSMGSVYVGLGDERRALAIYNQALGLFQAAKSASAEAEILVVIGEVFYSLGESRKALEYYDRALPIIRSLGLRRAESYALRYSGRAYDSLGERRQALNYYRRALPLYRAGGDRRGEAYVLTDLGIVYRSLGRRGPALESYHRALALNRSAGDRLGESQTLYHLAQLELDGGRLDLARAHLDAAFKLVESLRSRVVSHELRTSYFASVHQYYELYIDLLMRLHEQRPSGSFGAAALEASERARARGLLELLAEARADIRRGADRTLIGREGELRRQINLKADRLMQLRGRAAPEIEAGEAAAVEKEIADLVAERDQVEAQIRVKSPRYAALAQPQPASLAEIQQLLDGETLLLEYALGGTRSYLWAVTPTSISGYTLPPRAEIERAARRVHQLLTAARPAPGVTREQHEAQYWQRAGELSRLLLGPVAARLGRKRLLIVTEGVLQYLPFAALPEPAAGDGGRVLGVDGRADRHPTSNTQPLMVDHEIVNLPSASTLAVLRRETGGRGRAPKTVAVLADPVFEADDVRLAGARAGAGQVAEAALTAQIRGAFGRLHWSRREAEAIRRLTPPGEGLFFTDFDANFDRATSAELGQYRYIHFATHGVLDSENPELSAIVLSLVDEQRRERKGYLRLHDIYDLNLPAELVVLSACNSGLGKEIKGEGLIGLTRGFIYAGAARVVASLWRVDDEATSELMKHFYAGMLKAGLPPAAALREAQLAIRQQPLWGAPYYWAAFVLQGEWR